MHVLGPLEARMQPADVMILGGMNEGTWPRKPAPDPWMSRAMRAAFGLPEAERRIGLAAHDVLMACGAPTAIFTRSEKSGGAPTEPSRWLRRLDAVLAAGGDVRLAQGPWLDWARALDRPERSNVVTRPEPRPPRLVRPARLSVTEIETLLRDPYSIYARHVLGLMPLETIDAPLGASERGSVIHDALGDYTQAMARNASVASSAGRLDWLLAIGREKFSALLEHGEARALWWPRFVRIADWYVNQWETSRNADAVYAEQSGRMTFSLTGRDFVLTARADRIERHGDGSFAILDFKTGLVPSSKQVRLGLSPQLTLEAAILRAGGFAGVPAGASLKELVYVKLSGNEPAGEEMPVNLNEDRNDDTTPDKAADVARAELEKVIRAFDDEKAPNFLMVVGESIIFGKK